MMNGSSSNLYLKVGSRHKCGAVHTDLMNNRMIKDPFYGVNEKSLQWIGERIGNIKDFHSR